LIKVFEKLGNRGEEVALAASSKENSQAEKLTQEAKAWGLHCQDMKHDGNCFFHGVENQLKVQEVVAYKDLTQDQLRATAADHILRNFDLYKATLSENPHAFILKISQDRTWADHQIILALSRELNITIAIIRSDGGKPDIFKRANPVATIYLGYEVGQHYQSLIFQPGAIPSKSIRQVIESTAIDNFQVAIGSAVAPAVSPKQQGEQKQAGKQAASSMPFFQLPPSAAAAFGSPASSASASTDLDEDEIDKNKTTDITKQSDLTRVSHHPSALFGRHSPASLALPTNRKRPREEETASAAHSPSDRSLHARSPTSQAVGAQGVAAMETGSSASAEDKKATASDGDAVKEPPTKKQRR